jgi:FAD/FMN-containing dehydrogenase
MHSATAVVLVIPVKDVFATLESIRENITPFTVRGEGYSASGAASFEGGLVIDLPKMRKATINAEAETITTKGGALWRDVDLEDAEHDLATVGGAVNHAGEGRLTFRGGYG